jgi:hypothetical protein
MLDRTDSLSEMPQWTATVLADEARQYLLLLLQGKAKQAEREVRQQYTLAQRAQIAPATAEAAPRRRSLAELHTLAEGVRTKRLERQKKQKQRALEK